MYCGCMMKSSHLRTVTKTCFIFVSYLKEKWKLTWHNDIQHEDSWTQKSKRNITQLNSIFVDPFSKSLKHIVSQFVAMSFPKHRKKNPTRFRFSYLNVKYKYCNRIISFNIWGKCPSRIPNIIMKVQNENGCWVFFLILVHRLARCRQQYAFAFLFVTEESAKLWLFSVKHVKLFLSRRDLTVK